MPHSAAQNMAVAAESKGLGMCYIGSLRNDMSKVIDILDCLKAYFPIWHGTDGRTTKAA